MSVSVGMTGREAIGMLRQIFNIEQKKITRIELIADCNDICRMTIHSIAAPAGKTEIESREVEEATYEVSIKRVSMKKL